MSRHAYADPFEAPGERDLTAHVDFAALAGAARADGRARVRARSAQGDWLEAMGIALRAAALAKRPRPSARAEIADGARPAHRARAQMGRLFKAMALSRPAGPSRRGSEHERDHLSRRRRPPTRLLMARIGRESFTETFGHLYTPENLAAFLVNHSEENWRGELADPRYAVRLAERRRRGGGLCQARPALAALRDRPSRPPSCANSTC